MCSSFPSPYLFLYPSPFPWHISHPFASVRMRSYPIACDCIARQDFLFQSVPCGSAHRGRTTPLHAPTLSDAALTGFVPRRLLGIAFNLSLIQTCLDYSGRKSHYNVIFSYSGQNHHGSALDSAQPLKLKRAALKNQNLDLPIREDKSGACVMKKTALKWECYV